MNSHRDSKPVTSELTVGDRAPAVELLDHSGNPVNLASLWQARPRVLLFVRHFG